MELVFKVPDHQSPLIGILYESEKLAAEVYSNIFSDSENQEFFGRIEIIQSSVNLTLISRDGRKIEYKNLSFSKEELRKFTLKIKPERHFIFVHLDNEGKIALPLKGQKIRFISVKGYELINAQF